MIPAKHSNHNYVAIQITSDILDIQYKQVRLSCMLSVDTKTLTQYVMLLGISLLHT